MLVGNAATAWGHVGVLLRGITAPSRAHPRGRQAETGRPPWVSRRLQLPPVGGRRAQWNYFRSCNKEEPYGGGETGINPTPDAVTVLGAPMGLESSNRGLCITLLV